MKKICCHLFCSHKFYKIENYFIFEILKKKIWTIFQRIIEHFTQKCVTKLSEIWVWDPGSEIRKKPIPDPGSGTRNQKGTGSRIRIRNSAFDFYHPDADPDFYLMLIQVTKMIRIRIHNTAVISVVWIYNTKWLVVTLRALPVHVKFSRVFLWLVSLYFRIFLCFNLEFS
jgi:hypothetical protein